MAEKFSDGLRDFMMYEGSFAKALEDSVIRIYQGSAPASANDEATGVELCEVSVSSGTVSLDERSTPRIYQLLIAHSGAPDVGDKVKLLINGTDAYEYTVTASESTVALLALKVAQMLDDIPNIEAVATTTDGYIWVRERVAGVALTIADNTSTGGITTSPTSKQSPTRSDALVFDPPVSGVVSKPSGSTWSGLIEASGTASYFRQVRSDDDGSHSHTAVRYQGACGVGGAELNLSTLILVKDATLTITGFDVTFPEA